MRTFYCQLVSTMLLGLLFFACEQSSTNLSSDNNLQQEQLKVLPTDTLAQLLQKAENYYFDAQLDSALILYQVIEKQPLATLDTLGKTIYLKALIGQVEQVHIPRRALSKAQSKVNTLLSLSEKWKSLSELMVKIHLLAAEVHITYGVFDSSYHHINLAARMPNLDVVDSVNVFLKWSEHHFSSINYDTAQIYADSALQLSENFTEESQILNAHSYLAKAKVLTLSRSLEEATQAVEKATSIYSTFFAEKHFVFGYCNLQKADIANFSRSFEDQRKYTTLASEIFDSTISENPLLKGYIYFLMGESFQLQEDMDYLKANEYHKKTLKYYELAEGDKFRELSLVYNTLASSYKYIGNIQLGIKYAERTLALRLKRLKSPSRDLARSYANLGIREREIGNIEKAIDYMNKAIRELEALDKANDPDLPVVYYNLAWAYRKIDKDEQALELYLETLKIEKALYGLIDYYVASDYSATATGYEKLHQYDMMENMLDTALYIMDRLPINKRSEALRGTIYAQYSDLYYAQKNYQKAIDYMRQGIDLREKTTREGLERDLAQLIKFHYLNNNFKAVAEEQKKLEDYILPKGYSIEDIEDTPISPAQKVYISNARRTLADSYLKQAQNKQLDTILLKKALSNYELSIKIRSAVFKKLEDYEARMIILKENTALYEAATNTALILVEQTKDKKYLSDVFDLMEMNKAATLNEKIKESEASIFANLPEDILEQENDLEKTIAYYEKLKFEEKQEEKIKTYEEEIFQLKRAKDSLLQTLQQQYPDYYNLKYRDNSIAIADLQISLHAQNAGLIEFFYGDTTLIALFVDSETLDYQKIPLDSTWKDDFQQFSRSLNAPLKDSTENQMRKSKQDYATYAHQFYQQLIAPFQAKLETLEHLIIIPDGQLSYLPFELLCSEAGKQASFRELPYLFKSYVIQYEYAANLLQNKPLKTLAANDFLGFAPLFDGKTDDNRSALRSENIRSLNGNLLDLSSLPYAKVEVEEIGELTSGKTIIHADATEEVFKKEAQEYNILHLGTHAIINDEHPNYSFLAFTPTKDTTRTEDQFLYAYELCNMRLNANLAVLSACETGVGQFQKGEGIKSLSWAFKYAGCPNVVTSLWKANDQSTSQLMVNFYEQLKAGKGKADALQAAKLDFLASAEEKFTHPFYWGNFILIGDNEVVEIGSSQLWILILCGIFVVLAMIFTISKRRTKQRQM